jgi:hypothetical protein
MKKLLVIVTIASFVCFLGGGIAFGGLVDPIVNTNTNTNTNANTNVNTNANANNNMNTNTNLNSNIQGQNQNQGQIQGQLQGQMQGQVGIVNDGDQIVTVEKPNTQIPIMPSVNVNPYEGSVKDATADFTKYPMDDIVFASSDTVITAVVDIDKFKGIGMLNTWEARKHILKKVKKLEKKHGKICVIVTTRQGSHQYGFNPGSAGSANPTASTGAMGGGTLGWAMNLATEMAVVEFCTYK